MTPVEVVLSLVKILLLLTFFLMSAALATWGDRRQASMVQDRVGPNRATILLPSLLVRGAFIFVPALVAMPSAFMAMRVSGGKVAFERMAIAGELAVLVGWFCLALLSRYVRSRGAVNRFEAKVAEAPPRQIFLVGLALHVFVLVLASALSGTPTASLGAQVASATLAAVLLASGLYAASRVPEAPIPLRLAGILHAIADTIKLIWKEDFIPKNADRLLHSLAPMLAMFPALVTFAVIPFGHKLCFAEGGERGFDFSDLGRLVKAVPSDFACSGHVVSLQIADLNVGILYLFAMAGTGVIGAAIAGWASDNKFSLLGGLRAASQMVSYEVAMGLSLVGIFIVFGSVRLQDMVEWQAANAWGVFVQPFAFVLFLAALAAETKRVPFDQPEGESEIVAGYFVEYSGMKFGMFFTGEYVELIVSSALLTTLFFGGYALPFLHHDGLRIAIGDAVLLDYKMTHAAVTLLQVLTFFGKTVFITWMQIFFRWTLPRFRYDQLMRLGWTKLLPLAIANLLVTGVVVLGIDSAGPAVAGALRVAADLTQVVVGVGIFAGLTALVVFLLEPPERTTFVGSSSTRLAAARGGVKPTPQQA